MQALSQLSYGPFPPEWARRPRQSSFGSALLIPRPPWDQVRRPGLDFFLAGPVLEVDVLVLELLVGVDDGKAVFLVVLNLDFDVVLIGGKASAGGA